jgi:hypothetical protein
MTDVKPATKQNSNFDLKTRYVDLQTPLARSVRSIRELDALRVAAKPVSASKHGLEVICGASCETGAQ